MLMIMTDNEKTSKKQTPKNADLRESIVQRLKAHDAAVRATSLADTPETTPSSKQ